MALDVLGEKVNLGRNWFVSRSAMAELDRIREQISYLKYWQGIMVVTDISLVGWLITVAENPPWRTFTLAIVGVIALSFGILDLHRRVERHINRIGKL